MDSEKKVTKKTKLLMLVSLSLMALALSCSIIMVGQMPNAVMPKDPTDATHIPISSVMWGVFVIVSALLGKFFWNKAVQR